VEELFSGAKRDAANGTKETKITCAYMEVRNEELHPKEGALIMIIINMPMPVN
jgi:hypothetical protein